MMEILCGLIGRLLWLSIVAYELLQLIWRRLHALASRSYDYWRCDQRALFERAVHELQKLPQHLVLIIGPDERYVDVEQLKRIFGYAQIVSIPYISVYDRRTPRDGYVDVSRICQSSSEARSYLWPPKQTNNEQKFQQNGYKIDHHHHHHRITNGNVSNGAKYEQLQVYQIDGNDGHALIADVCRELYEKRRTSEVQELLKERQALTNALDALLNKRLGFAVPEPELGIVFSRQTCIYGLLPWHARFTEFHTHHTGEYFGPKTFARVLYKYARCEQRWGK